MQILKIEIQVTQHEGVKTCHIHTDLTERSVNADEDALGTFLYEWLCMFEKEINKGLFNQLMNERLNQMMQVPTN